MFPTGGRRSVECGKTSWSQVGVWVRAGVCLPLTGLYLGGDILLVFFLPEWPLSLTLGVFGNLLFGLKYLSV
jgi:hypothetical protein